MVFDINSRKDEDFYFTYPQEENSDWGYARNRFFALKRTDSCWTSSLFSVSFEEFTLPNRDHPQQGLLCMVDSEYSKFLDCVMFKLSDNEGAVELEATKVEISPWKVKYFYSGGDMTLKVSFFLAINDREDGAGGWIEFETDADKELELTVSPLVDIRGLGEESPGKEEYRIEERDGLLSVSRGERKILFSSGESFSKSKDRVEWNYKLGNGERKINGTGEVVFGEEIRNPLKVGEMKVTLDGSLKVGVACGGEVSEDDLEFYLDQSEEEDREEARRILDEFSVGREDLKDKFGKMRLLTLCNFGTREGGMEIPEAGEWWFREVWFRDLFESIYHNMDFYRKIKGEEWLKNLFNWSKIYIENGIMANKPSRGDINYCSIDASLLYLLSMARFYEETGDDDFREETRDTFDSIVEDLGADSLIKCRANYSWIDSKIDGRSTRIPESWDVNDGNFLLPEVNALWVRVLEKYENIYDGDVETKKIWGKYKETFWNKNKEFPYQLVYRNGDTEMKDDTESSVGAASIGILDDYFFGYEVMGAWKTIKEKLLVRRKPLFFNKENMAFGILTKNSGEKVYLDDRQYHEATVWPRELPYLFRLLDKIGRRNVIEEITTNLLDHQMGEGAVFYNQELFSLPEGKNPSEGILPENPVPVKNPVQLWSHFLPEYLEEK